jgi:hypothetical protein
MLYLHDLVIFDIQQSLDLGFLSIMIDFLLRTTGRQLVLARRKPQRVCPAASHGWTVLMDPRGTQVAL